MVEIKNNNKYKIGDKVWYFDAWGNLRDGVIYEIKGEYAGTKEGKHGGVQAGAKLINCWPSKEACLEAERQRSEAQKAEYREMIKSAEDLIPFMWNHDINSEDPDYDAREVVKERAAEFGINLEE